MNENSYLTEAERYNMLYNIDYEFRQMLFRYKDYLHVSRTFLTNEKIALKIALSATDIGVLTLFLREKNKKGLTKFNYNFIK